MKEDTTDVLVIGAGPAGVIAAATIFEAGYTVRVVERTQFPRFVIGESLLPRCMDVLQETGLLEAVKAKGYQEKFGARFIRDAEAIADYNFSEQFTKGWSWTWQVPRASFDMTLVDEIKRRGIPVDFNTEVTHIQFNEDGSSQTTINSDNGNTESVKARFIVDASGYGRVIPRMFKLDRPSTLPARKAVFVHVKDIRRAEYDEPDRIIILVYAPGVWAWIIPFSDGTTSLGVVGMPDMFEDYGTTPEEQLQRLIANNAYLKARFSDVPIVLAPRKLEAWSTVSERFHGNGFVLTGNVTEFLDPVFSSGVMFASVSGQLAGQLTVKQLKGDAVDWQQAYDAELQRGVTTFRAFIDAWYDGTLDTIFYTKEKDALIKTQITSILAGYVWDETNPFVQRPDAALRNLARRIEARDRFMAQQNL